MLIKEITGFDAAKYYEFALKKFDYTNFPDLVQFREMIIDLTR
jgi:hypothetical protein